jgi:hypothetical protein
MEAPPPKFAGLYPQRKLPFIPLCVGTALMSPWQQPWTAKETWPGFLRFAGVHSVVGDIDTLYGFHDGFASTTLRWLALFR